MSRRWALTASREHSAQPLPAYRIALTPELVAHALAAGSTHVQRSAEHADEVSLFLGDQEVVFKLRLDASAAELVTGRNGKLKHVGAVQGRLAPDPTRIKAVGDKVRRAESEEAEAHQVVRLSSLDQNVMGTNGERKRKHGLHFGMSSGSGLSSAKPGLGPGAPKSAKIPRSGTSTPTRDPGAAFRAENVRLSAMKSTAADAKLGVRSATLNAPKSCGGARQEIEALNDSRMKIESQKSAVSRPGEGTAAAAEREDGKPPPTIVTAELDAKSANTKQTKNAHQVHENGANVIHRDPEDRQLKSTGPSSQGFEKNSHGLDPPDKEPRLRSDISQQDTCGAKGMSQKNGACSPASFMKEGVEDTRVSLSDVEQTFLHSPDNSTIRKPICSVQEGLHELRHFHTALELSSRLEAERRETSSRFIDLLGPLKVIAANDTERQAPTNVSDEDFVRVRAAYLKFRQRYNDLCRVLINLHRDLQKRAEFLQHFAARVLETPERSGT
ncbi:hypothetical protein FVE85_6693 [Porphyridium purpureum]|uniref:Uncharacterized protein n=1 Tax=Porphyridium purpureum TaxID=35688 RepID=A0A5J4Z7A9_PORPP|nr:hypothetical protein FVE85_6693 [Porphyridium purpureum]|eukprot:POR0027..scf295_1